jgi:geranylgeranylglycerol-phosphate geranylgeranyltransferase
LKFKLISYFNILRPINFFITFLTAIVAVFLCSKNNFLFSIAILAGLSSGFTASAGNVINDVFDIEIDKVNRPQRPLASGSISKTSATILYSVLIIISVALSYFINLNALLIVLATTFILFLYSRFFKKIPLVGNIIIAFLTGLVFIYGGVTVENPVAAFIPALFAFLINLIREIVKDMQDVEGDKKAEANTFPIKYGFQKSKSLTLFFVIILILLTCYPFFFHLYKIEYFIFVMIVVNPLLIYSVKILFKNHSTENLNKISNLLKLDMVLGLIAIYLGI